MKILIWGILIFSCKFAYSQQDTIITQKAKIPCTITLISQESINFHYKGEALNNILPISEIFYIKFKSGRHQYFLSSRFNELLQDPQQEYDNINFTDVEENNLNEGSKTEIEVITPEFSNYLEFIKSVYRKKAALLGARKIFIYPNAQTLNHKNNLGENYISIKGYAYSSPKIYKSEFQSLLKNKKKFSEKISTSLKIDLDSFIKRSSFERKNNNSEIEILGISGNSSQINISCRPNNSKGDPYTVRLVGYSDKSFWIYFKENNIEYNVEYEF